MINIVLNKLKIKLVILFTSFIFYIPIARYESVVESWYIVVVVKCVDVKVTRCAPDSAMPNPTFIIVNVVLNPIGKYNVVFNVLWALCSDHWTYYGRK